MAEEAPTPPAKKKRKKGGKAGKIIIICSALIVAISLLGGLSYYLGVVHMLMGWEQPQSHAELEIGKPVFHSLPQIRTDLKTNECRAPFIRATVDVQLAPGDVDRLIEAQDQIMDAILTHLRGQERQHVVGKASSERLRFELVQIIENVIQPAKVQTILFKELVLQ
jgi:flagellar FliL protein